MIHTIIRFVENKKYLEEIQHGEIRFKPISYYENLEHEQYDKIRGDSDEGIVALYQADKVNMQIGDVLIESNDILGPIKISRLDVKNRHVVCFYRIDSIGWDSIPENKINEYLNHLKIDKRVKAFGEWGLVISDLEEFLNRIKQSVLDAGLSGIMGIVNYYDPNTYHGKIPSDEYGLWKNNDYKYQNEYRIILDINDKLKEYYLKIPSIEDISFIASADEIFNKLKIQIGNNYFKL